MSAAVTEAMMMNHSANNSTTTESAHAVTSKLAIQTDVEMIKCDCCGLTEECTAAYINMITERYQGKWICGLCAEAVNYEMRLLNIEDALIQHMSFCNQFKSAVPPPNPAVHLISAMTHILRRSMSPKKHGGGLNRSKISVPVLSSLSLLDQNLETDTSEHPRTDL
ncbi:Amyotrophic lateral sclerosis 2 chromosomal region candidate protein [Heracleum sosnowskyi]|uniref:Amyotrophic lateral sclerosis 2 chromosomal region candidate protein n=1 Tax=Heracleum sosnowskyi TaxID=360622 RepID=A0AAD8H3F6_9APIA|nr:Amyotrophic lateral sclerosis 2 chromosomal region candidate protein [Heracleum sosnowskyi]